MTDLRYIEQQLAARVLERRLGTASRFRLMEAADAVRRAIEAEDRETPPANDTAAPAEEDAA